MASDGLIRVTHREREDAVEGLLAAMAAGIAAVPLIAVWLAAVRLCEQRSQHKRLPLAVQRGRPRLDVLSGPSAPGTAGPAGPAPWTAPGTRAS